MPRDIADGILQRTETTPTYTGALEDNLLGEKIRQQSSPPIFRIQLTRLQDYTLNFPLLMRAQFYILLSPVFHWTRLPKTSLYRRSQPLIVTMNHLWARRPALMSKSRMVGQ